MPDNVNYEVYTLPAGNRQTIRNIHFKRISFNGVKRRSDRGKRAASVFCRAHLRVLWPKLSLRCRDWPVLSLRCGCQSRAHLSASFGHSTHLSATFGRSGQARWMRSRLQRLPQVLKRPGGAPRHPKSEGGAGVCWGFPLRLGAPPPLARIGDFPIPYS